MTNREQLALYFSRSSTPYHRDAAFVSFDSSLGVYAFRKEALARFCRPQPSPSEELERLEQLRAIHNGMSILVVKAKTRGFGIDTLEDLAQAQEKLSNP